MQCFVVIQDGYSRIGPHEILCNLFGVHVSRTALEAGQDGPVWMEMIAGIAAKFEIEFVYFSICKCIIMFHTLANRLHVHSVPKDTLNLIGQGFPNDFWPRDLFFNQRILFGIIDGFVRGPDNMAGEPITLLDNGG